jgi:hypothetical protein
MGINVVGIKEVRALIREGQLSVINATRKEVFKVATDIKAKAQSMVPFDEGTLHGSADVTTSADMLSATITFGGPAAPYALIQHEDESLWHPPKPPGNRRGATGTGPTSPPQRGPKYLEYPANLAAATFEADLAGAIRKAP